MFRRAREPIPPLSRQAPIVLALVLCASAPMSDLIRDRIAPAFVPPERTYNYAPCLMLERGGARMHAWYCANREPGQVTDCLWYRSAIRRDGQWKWSHETVALAPSPDRSSWDSRHVCDPEVVAGRFRFRGAVWRYAMLYLATDAERSTHNQVGVAFANAPAGPWTRHAEPIVSCEEGPDAGPIDRSMGWPVYRHWGVGQPSAISLDRRGKLLLFYSRGESVHGEEMVEADLSDMDRGPVVSSRRRVPVAGLRHKRGTAPPTLTNISVALDERAGRLYMVREALPPDDDRFPGFIASYVQVASIGWRELLAGRGEWTVLGDVDASSTGWPRNHNAAIARDEWGRVQGSGRLTLGISVAEACPQAPPDFAWLWTYRVTLLDWPLP